MTDAVQPIDNSIQEVYDDIGHFVIGKATDYLLEVDVYPLLDGAVAIAGNHRAFHGHIKWDGCSNWDFQDDSGAMTHYCSKKQAADLGVLLGRIYDLAAQVIPHWSNE